MKKHITASEVVRDSGFTGSDFGKWVRMEGEKSAGMKYLKVVVKEPEVVE